MSVEAVAARAGVGKTTIYRRFCDKADLTSAAVSRLTEIDRLPDSGNTRADLVTLVLYTKKHRDKMSMIGTLLVEEKRNPKLFKLFRRRVIMPRRLMIKKVLERAAGRGELRAEADTEAAADALIGAFFAHYLAGLPFHRGWEDAIVDAIWSGIKRSSVR